MSLPKKYKISKKDAILGATTSYGFPKSILDTYPPDYINDELIEMLNNHKPMIITSIKTTNIGLNKEKDLYDYIKSKQLYIIHINLLNTKTFNTNIIKQQLIVMWSQPKYTKNALLLYLHYYIDSFPKHIINKYNKELNILKKSLNVSEQLIKFSFHYITGTLLGYRPSSIEGYYINKYYCKDIYKDLTLNEQTELNKLGNKQLLEKFKSARKKFKASPLYNIYIKEYPIFVKKCDKWIKYILNDSQMFKEYFDIYKHKIELFSPTN